MCHEKGCIKDAVYNFKDIRKPILCLTHKKDSMIDTSVARCSY